MVNHNSLRPFYLNISSFQFVTIDHPIHYLTLYYTPAHRWLPLNHMLLFFSSFHYFNFILFQFVLFQLYRSARQLHKHIAKIIRTNLAFEELIQVTGKLSLEYYEKKIVVGEFGGSWTVTNRNRKSTRRGVRWCHACTTIHLIVFAKFGQFPSSTPIAIGIGDY